MPAEALAGDAIVLVSSPDANDIAAPTPQPLGEGYRRLPNSPIGLSGRWRAAESRPSA
jgi:hypothetical protein